MFRKVLLMCLVAFAAVAGAGVADDGPWPGDSQSPVGFDMGKALFMGLDHEVPGIPEEFEGNELFDPTIVFDPEVHDLMWEDNVEGGATLYWVANFPDEFTVDHLYAMFPDGPDQPTNLGNYYLGYLAYPGSYLTLETYGAIPFPRSSMSWQDYVSGRLVENEAVWFKYHTDPDTFCVGSKTDIKYWMPFEEGQVEVTYTTFTPLALVTSEYAAQLYGEIFASIWDPPPQPDDDCDGAITLQPVRFGDGSLVGYFDRRVWSVVSIKDSGEVDVISPVRSKVSVLRSVLDTGGGGRSSGLTKSRPDIITPEGDLRCFNWGVLTGVGGIAGAGDKCTCCIEYWDKVKTANEDYRIAVDNCRSDNNIRAGFSVIYIITCCGGASAGCLAGGVSAAWFPACCLGGSVICGEISRETRLDYLRRCIRQANRVRVKAIIQAGKDLAACCENEEEYCPPW